jgi:hypothetical protein
MASAEDLAEANILPAQSWARLSERLKQRAHRSRVHHIVHIVRLVSVHLVSIVYRHG